MQIRQVFFSKWGLMPGRRTMTTLEASCCSATRSEFPLKKQSFMLLKAKEI